MKKNKIRAALAANKRAQNARMQYQSKFWLCALLLFAIIAVIGILADPTNSAASVVVLAGTNFASMAVIGNIADVTDREVAGEAISYKVWLIETNQLDDSQAFPTPNAAREVATLPLLAGEYFHYFEAHDIPTYNSSGEKGDLTIASTNTFAIIMGGVREKLLDFIEQKAGGKFIIVFKECESSNYYIIGNPCKPMILKSYATKNDKDNRSVTFTFENKTIKQYNKYVGSVLTAAPAVHAADATQLSITRANDTYQIPDGSAATYAIATVTGLTNNDSGRIITLKGLGTTKSATIADNAAFVLADGATWTAKAGSQLTLRVLDAATLIEVPGTRIQTA